MKIARHPVLSSRAYFTAYSVLWATITLLFIVLVHAADGVPWKQSTVLLAPMMAFYAVLGLSVWYVCKTLPFRSATDLRVYATHVTAALALSYLWMEGGALYANLLWHSDSRYGARQTVLLLDGVLFYLLVVGFFYAVMAVESSREAERRAAATVALAREAELRALRAQINPHFLFNSLNSISALTSIDAAKAREMCLLLADFLRLTLGMGERTVIPLSDELDLLEKFMAIEKVRFGDRLRIEENIQDQARKCLIPALLLQPLLENAVSHGIASLAEGGWIKLQAQVLNARLGIVVENERDDEAPSRRRNGVGLKNVRSRLEARYGKDANFRVEPSEDRFLVSLSLPAEFGEVK